MPEGAGVAETPAGRAPRVLTQEARCTARIRPLLGQRQGRSGPTGLRLRREDRHVIGAPVRQDPGVLRDEPGTQSPGRCDEDAVRRVTVERAR